MAKEEVKKESNQEKTIELPGGGKVEVEKKETRPVKKARKKPVRKPVEKKPETKALEPEKEPEKKEEKRRGGIFSRWLMI